MTDNIVHLSGPNGSSAKITLFGAHVVSFKTSAGKDALFMSSKSSLTGPDPIRGGIPICWPAFAFPDKDSHLKNVGLHGFARQKTWSQQKSDNPAKGIFTLTADSETKKVFESDFELTYTVEIVSESSLKVTFDVANPSSASSKLEFQFALHNYLQLPEGVMPEDVAIEGALAGIEYKDLVGGGTMHKEERKTFQFSGETGRIYSPVPSKFEANYGGKGTLQVSTSGLEDLVTFQPGEKKAIPDLHEGGWKSFVCYEPGRINKLVSLEAGGTWSASQELTLQ